MRTAVAFGAMCVLSACSTLPSVEDYTALAREQVVTLARCELRDGFRAHLLGALEREERVKIFPDLARIANKLRLEPTNYYNIQQLGIPTPVFNVLKQYAKTQIAYDFEFDISETNNVGAGVNFLPKVSFGILSINPSASANLKRQRTSSSRHGDVAEDLIANPRLDDLCNGLNVAPNRGYPLTGSLDLGKSVHDFLNSNQGTNLIGPSDKVAAHTQTDKILFVTTLNAGIKNSISVTNTTNLQLNPISLNLSGERLDSHRLTLTFVLPEEPEAGKAARSRAPVLTAGKLAPSPSVRNANQELDFRLQLDTQREIADALRNR